MNSLIGKTLISVGEREALLTAEMAADALPTVVSPDEYFSEHHQFVEALRSIASGETVCVPATRAPLRAAAGAGEPVAPVHAPDCASHRLPNEYRFDTCTCSPTSPPANVVAEQKGGGEGHQHSIMDSYIIGGPTPPRCECGATLYPVYPSGSEWR